MTKDKTTPTPVTEGKPISEAPDVQVRDAWDHMRDLVKGLDDLFYCMACSDEGIGPDGARALEVIADRLGEHVATVDGFFRPMEEE